MKITNRKNLPKTLLKFIDTEPHNKEGEISATTLLKGNKEIILTKRHWDEIEVDISDMIFAIFGSAVHYLLEHEEPDTFVEEQLSREICGMIVTGKIDLYDMARGHIDDYKTASIWKVIHNDFKDWRRQGLIYSWLVSVNDLPIKSVRFIAFLKDHSKRKARYDSSYPDSPTQEYQFMVTDENLLEIESFIYSKVSSLKDDIAKEDDLIEPCTREERWQKPSKFAVMKVGRKSAVKLHDTLESATQHKDELGSLHYVEERKEENTKCLDYCSVNKFCSFYKQLQEDGLA